MSTRDKCGPLRLRTATVINDPLEAALHFVEVDGSYQAYDLAAVLTDNTLSESDVRVANRIIARMGQATIAAILSRRPAIEAALAVVPASATLLGAPEAAPWDGVAVLFAAFKGTAGVGSRGKRIIRTHSLEQIHSREAIRSSGRRSPSPSLVTDNEHAMVQIVGAAGAQVSVEATHQVTEQNLSIAAVLQSAAETTPARVALTAPGRAPLTYVRLYHLVQEVQRALRGSGLGRTDHVGVVVPNGREMATAFLAVAASATCAPLSPGYRTHEFDYCLADLGIKALVVQSGTASPAIAAARRRGVAVFDLEPAAGAEAGVFAFSSDGRHRTAGGEFAHPDDTALVLHTSGTIARPKVVPLTHTNICVSAANIATTLSLTPEDRCLNVIPLHHIHGLIGATLSTLVAGGSIVCPPDFEPARFFN